MKSFFFSSSPRQSRDGWGGSEREGEERIMLPPAAAAWLPRVIINVTCSKFDSGGEQGAALLQFQSQARSH